MLHVYCLIASHASTGSDYTASFSRKGKINPFKILEKDSELQQAFTLLGNDNEVSESIIESIERFVCKIYSKKKLTSVNEARLEYFISKYKTKNEESRLSSVKKLDGSALPPCSRVLIQKIMRTQFVACRWLNAYVLLQPDMSPIEYGWRLTHDNQYQLNWFAGEMSPKALDIMHDIEDTQENEG